MSTRDTILEIIREEGPISGASIARKLGISRQAVHKHLRKLREQGEVYKEGAKRGARFLAGEGEPRTRKATRELELEGLQEDEVYEEFELLLNLKSKLSRQAADILHYAFCEMLNNAIDHSESRKCRIEFQVGPINVEFVVRDYGVGVFQSVGQKFDYERETRAVQELLKGKLTTMPERHSGEGIFFTSKAGDRVTFRSHRLKLIFDNDKSDVFLEAAPHQKGTEVTFRLAKHSRSDLADVFSEYAPEEYDFSFEKSRVYVKLHKDKYMSRSEARRLVSRLGEFEEVVLDFTGVNRIGQGFADEIFRVFPRREPGICIETENVAPEIAPMIEHVVDKQE